MMNKKLMIGLGVAGVAGVACLAAGKKCQDQPQETIWEKMRKGMEEMPPDFPPRMMFDNVEATKANTDEILDLLREQRVDEPEREVVGTA